MAETGYGIDDRNARSLTTLTRVIQLSQQQFALVLVRCNYVQVRDRVTQDLQAALPWALHVLHLPETTKTLYRTIQQAIAAVTNDPEEELHALMIVGLEELQELDSALIATNIVREELRKQFAFPLILWVNDDVLRALERLAPDLSSWAGNAIIEFEMVVPELLRSLRHHSDRLFDTVLNLGDDQFWAAWQLPPSNALRPNELKFAINDLQTLHPEIDPPLQASLDFLQGQLAHSQGEMETARELYERSLAFWLSPPPPIPEPPPIPSAPAPLPPIPHLERAACVLFYLGLWWRSYASLQRAIYHNACQQASRYFQRSLELFAQENRQDLVARFITAQAETLQKLERWDDLEAIAKQSLVLHRLFKDRVREARDRGFLAEVAIARSDWNAAKQHVEAALKILDSTEQDLHADGHPADPALEANLDVAQRYHTGWYLFLLATAEKELGNLNLAIHHLECARDQSHPHNDPPLYIRILRNLRDYYFIKGDYRLAFRTRQARRLIEHQYGYRAFIGALHLQPQDFVQRAPLPLPAQIDQQRLLAQELEASGRQRDLNQLLARLSQAQYKLIVLHGPSGVGKSSMLNAGLLPSLQEQTIEGRLAIPVVLDYYNDWETVLCRSLRQTQAERPEPAIADPDLLPEPEAAEATNSLIATLKTAIAHNDLPILLLDQFEEFFFTYPTVQERLPFYQVLGDCLKLPFVKVVLSLREDYLHYLLEFQRYADLDIINHDILGKDIRYPLGDLSPADAKAVITHLTERAQFYLPDDLIDALVQDLAGALGEVRPIELQVVGAQLQAEDIETLAAYRERGPKEKLVQRSLEDVVQDCGPENEDLARIILFSLTNENGARPLKTRDDLEADLVDLGLTHEIENLDLVLEVLLGSGLIFQIPDAPADCYQLVHDYLVSFIRQEQESQVAQLQAELQQERDYRRDTEARLNQQWQQQLAAEERIRGILSRQVQVLKRQLRRSRWALFALGALVLSAVLLLLR